MLNNNTIRKKDIDEINVGLKERFKLTITKSVVEDFAKISGDFNPLHMDETYAKSTEFGKRVCHGMLLASFFSRMVGMLIPGENALYLSQSLQFVSPCFIDDEIIVEAEVISKSFETRIINLRTTITKNTGECILRGEAKVLVRR